MGWFEPDYREDETFKSDTAWFNNWGFENCVTPGLVLDYARGQYAQALAACDLLDSKADSLFRFSATLATGVITAAGLIAPDQLFSGWLILPIGFWFASVVLALLARRSTIVARPISTKALMSLEDPEKADLILAASYQGVISGVAHNANWKAKRIDLAMWFCVLGIFMLCVCLFILHLT